MRPTSIAFESAPSSNVPHCAQENKRRPAPKHDRAGTRYGKLIVEAGGGRLEDVVQVTVLLANPADFAGMNEEYAKVFATEPPARAVTKLGVELPNVLVSIMMTAHVEA
ncbi:MAG TPA: RidA family protein [Kofleriaceae bacterium]|nr:RidA family protein [Kofleriaceae bacterium]